MTINFPPPQATHPAARLRQLLAPLPPEERDRILLIIQHAEQHPHKWNTESNQPWMHMSGHKWELLWRPVCDTGKLRVGDSEWGELSQVVTSKFADRSHSHWTKTWCTVATLLAYPEQHPMLRLTPTQLNDFIRMGNQQATLFLPACAALNGETP